MLSKVRALLRSRRGAFDLPSLMVGAVVSLLLGGVALGVTIGIVPWAQDSKARTNVMTLHGAQSTALATERIFLPTEDLVARGYLSDGVAATAKIGDDSVCFVAAARSGSGRVFYTASQMQTAEEYHSGDTVTCAGVDLPDLVAEVSP